MDQLSLLHADEVTCNLKQNKKQVNGSLFILTSNLREWAKEKPLFTWENEKQTWENDKIPMNYTKVLREAGKTVFNQVSIDI